MIKIDQNNLNLIEQNFNKLRSGDRNACKNISNILKDVFHQNFQISIINNKKQNQSNVMSVFPDQSVIDKIIECIINEEKDSQIFSTWKENTIWTIEIDSRILSNSIGLTDKELTALLLHEVGHVVSTDIPKRICRVLKLEYNKSVKSPTKYVMKNSVFKKFLEFPILNACVFNTNKNAIKNEMKADNFAIVNGYGNDLSSAIDKLIIVAGSSNDEAPDTEMEKMTLFSIDTVLQLQKRQNSIVKRNLGLMWINTPSTFIKNSIRNIQNIFINGSENGSVTESVKSEFISNSINSLLDDFYVSEFFFNKVHKLKRIDPADLDYIELEKNNIKSNDDKMLLVSYIYSKLDIIDYYIGLIDSKDTRYVVPHTREQLVNMRNRLDKMRVSIINYEIPEVKYGIQVGYPEGYEG